MKKNQRSFLVFAGSAFDVKEFHDVILRQGAVPLNVMEETVNSWLATQQNNND